MKKSFIEPDNSIRSDFSAGRWGQSHSWHLCAVRSCCRPSLELSSCNRYHMVQPADYLTHASPKVSSKCTYKALLPLSLPPSAAIFKFLVYPRLRQAVCMSVHVVPSYMTFNVFGINITYPSLPPRYSLVWLYASSLDSKNFKIESVFCSSLSL